MTTKTIVSIECDLCISRGAPSPAPGVALALGPFGPGREVRYLDVCEADRAVYDMLMELWRTLGRQHPVEPLGLARAPRATHRASQGLAAGAWEEAPVGRSGETDQHVAPDGLYYCPLQCNDGPWRRRAVWRRHLRESHPESADLYVMRAVRRYPCPDCRDLTVRGHSAWYAHRSKEHGKLRGSEPLPAPQGDPDERQHNPNDPLALFSSAATG